MKALFNRFAAKVNYNCRVTEYDESVKATLAKLSVRPSACFYFSTLKYLMK